MNLRGATALRRGVAGLAVVGALIALAPADQAATPSSDPASDPSTAPRAEEAPSDPAADLASDHAAAAAEWYRGPTSDLRAHRVDLGTQVTARTAPEGRPLGRPAYLRGRVHPTVGSVRVHLQERVDGRWRRVASSRTDARSRFRFQLPTDRLGTRLYRVVRPASEGVRRGVSPVRRHWVHRVVTYDVATRGRSAVDRAVFERTVAQVYADRRGWSRADLRFRQVRRGGSFTVVLAAASELPSFGPPCHPAYSCRSGRHVVINERNWRQATAGWRAAGGTIDAYRQMVLNHETGHWLGLGHRSCSAPGRLAPVMMQQSKGLAGCRPSPWPKPAELRAVRR